MVGAVLKSLLEKIMWDGPRQILVDYILFREQYT